MVICLDRSAYGPADATAIPLSLASLKSRMVLPFWFQLSLPGFSRTKGHKTIVVLVTVLCDYLFVHNPCRGLAL